jgi:hypothetical protein
MSSTPSSISREVAEDQGHRQGPSGDLRTRENHVHRRRQGLRHPARQDGRGFRHRSRFRCHEKPIDYQSLDHEPVRLLFLLIGKDSLVGAHIKLLSRISRLMNKEELRSRLLLQAESSAEILKILQEEEMNYLDV